jgi:hypothetical protein
MFSWLGTWEGKQRHILRFLSLSHTRARAIPRSTATDSKVFFLIITYSLMMPHIIVVRKHVRTNETESYAGGSVVTGRASPLSIQDR